MPRVKVRSEGGEMEVKVKLTIVIVPVLVFLLARRAWAPGGGRDMLDRRNRGGNSFRIRTSTDAQVHSNTDLCLRRADSLLLSRFTTP
jgi:hypothetical protein